MRKALIRDGIVVNIIELDDEAEWVPDVGVQIVDDPTADAQIGGRRSGDRFEPAPPSSIDPTRARLLELRDKQRTGELAAAELDELVGLLAEVVNT